MAKTMFDIIKKQNGETFAKAIRNYDNGIFDIPDLDKIVKYAGRDATPILTYLTSLKGVQIEEHGVYQDPITLLNRAGYDAYVATSLKQQNAIKKYFKHNEELCTFRDPNRFKNYFMINAVRKDVDKIKRASKPQREDEYGTSVISIQILKSGGFISIKNRYNHTVQSPDNTFNSNPDNIIPGLSASLKQYFNVDFSAQKVELPNGYVVINGQICRYKAEVENTYCAENFYARDGKIYEIDKRTQIMLGRGLLLDLKSKTILDVTVSDYSAFTMEFGPREKFIQTLNDAIQDKKLQITKNPLGGYDIVTDGTQILTVEDGEFVNINLPDADTIDLAQLNNLRGTLDFSNVKNLYLANSNLAQVTEIHFNPNANTVNLMNVSDIPPMPSGTVDFSGVEYLKLSNIRPRTQAISYITLPRNAKNIDINSLRGWELGGDVDISNANIATIFDIPMTQVSNIRFNPKAYMLTLYGTYGLKLKGDIDFSQVSRLTIHGADMSKVGDIKLNPNASYIELRHTNVRLHGALDFSGVQGLHLNKIDATGVTDIKFPKVAQQDHMILYGIDGLNVPTLDLSTVSGAYIYYTDMSKVAQILFNNNQGSVVMDHVTGLHGTLDMHGMKHIQIGDTNLKNTTWTPNNAAETIHLSQVKGLHGELDFSQVRNLCLSGADLSQVTPIHFNTHNANSIDVSFTKGLHGDLDFSGTKQLIVNGADLSRVTGLQLPQNPESSVDIDPKTLQLMVGKSKLEYKMLMFVEEMKKRLQKKGNDNETQQN